MYTFDHGLFMTLTFDGGTALDRVMLTISGTAMWLPLYALILWLVWRRSGWRGMSVFLVLMLLALGLCLRLLASCGAGSTASGGSSAASSSSVAASGSHHPEPNDPNHHT